ncbi:MAG: tRNA (N6-isopentenyl adenosine(37)-C2)-methylthiotransferase MiaB [Endomicrobium sp.]|nr:tRNA (N6-isopentenyl adenosine(37)-C2)-methylthiotransferase MiaB [Endomicrobium sp.]
MNYFIETIGCQMNVCESGRLGLALSKYGVSRADVLQKADIIILNTCSVRAQAEQKAFSFLGRAERFKEGNPYIKIVVVGCMAERISSKIKRRFKSVDLIVGAKDINSAALKIADLCSLSLDSSILGKAGTASASSNIVEYVTIMRGCNNYCSYCVVPFVRGAEKSLNVADILKECSSAAKKGAKEIMLLGQNVNSYRYHDVNFTSLLKEVEKIEGLERVSFMTNHPKDLSSELIDLMAASSKICSHIHLPMQSASDKILKMMNRNYTCEYYTRLVKKLRAAITDVSITTDIIVGFPGETDEDFKETLTAVKDIRFNGLYVFKYSPRPGTKAASLPDNVPLEEKKRRHRTVLEESNKISAEITASMVGTVQHVLAEEIGGGIIEGVTKNGHRVFIKTGNERDLGRHLDVIIKKAKINSLFGDII